MRSPAKPYRITDLRQCSVLDSVHCDHLHGPSELPWRGSGSFNLGASLRDRVFQMQSRMAATELDGILRPPGTSVGRQSCGGPSSRNAINNKPRPPSIDLLRNLISNCRADGFRCALPLMIGDADVWYPTCLIDASITPRPNDDTGLNVDGYVIVLGTWKALRLYPRPLVEHYQRMEIKGTPLTHTASRDARNGRCLGQSCTWKLDRRERRESLCNERCVQR